MKTAQAATGAELNKKFAADAFKGEMGFGGTKEYYGGLAGVGQLLYYSLEEAAEAYRVVAPGTVPMPRRSCKKAETPLYEI